MSFSLKGGFSFGYGSTSSAMTGHEYYLANESMRNAYLDTLRRPPAGSRLTYAEHQANLRHHYKPGLFGAMAARGGGAPKMGTSNSTNAVRTTDTFSRSTPAPSNSGLRAVDFDPVPSGVARRWTSGYTSTGRYVG